VLGSRQGGADGVPERGMAFAQITETIMFPGERWEYASFDGSVGTGVGSGASLETGRRENVTKSNDPLSELVRSIVDTSTVEM
jgi:hypothetical protein